MRFFLNDMFDQKSRYEILSFVHFQDGPRANFFLFGQKVV